ncbi:MAG TPA: glycosyltransferase family 39 protein [Gemmatimonadales bacterium]|nr:glycosyltransferase family 39 protein [Gemmatimonadales bacterium]
MKLENTEGSRERDQALLLTALLVLAVALRFYRLGEWNFQATEMFTLRDSLKPAFGNPRPLGYLLNYYLVRPFLPLDEFGLRLMPAIFGVLAIPAVYFVSRHLLGTRAALLGTLLLTFSPTHVMYSQLARYWSLVFFMCAIYPYALYIGFREQNSRALALGLVTAVLAGLAHPVSILLVGGPALLLLASLRRERLAALWSQNWVRWATLLLAIGVGLAAWRFIPMLQGWISQHDRSPGGSQFLHRTVEQGVKQIYYLFGLTEGLTAPIAIGGTVGMYLVWKERDKTLAVFLASLAFFPIAFVTLISIRTPVSQYYLVPVLPVFFMGTGVFLDRLFAVEWGLRPRWLLPLTILAMILLSGAPSLVSEYLNGRRYDFRGMARWMTPRLVEGDIVFSDQPMVLAHYLPATKVRHLQPDTTALSQSMRALQETPRDDALWIVAPTPGHAFRTNLRQGGLISWIFEKCQLRNMTGKGRVDLRQQYLQTYRCSPLAGNPMRAASSGESGR